MKILLIGPCPPPHGGVSVHVSAIQRQLMAAGMSCHVLDISRTRPGFRFGAILLRHVWSRWTPHLHTSGHNVKGWIVALWCALAGRISGGAVLTLHSGMVPGYLKNSSPWRRRLAAMACRLSRCVVCVSPAIRDAVVALGVPSDRTEVLPAFIGASGEGTAPSRSRLGNTSAEVGEERVQAWIQRHRPVFSTVLFFRPEYGFDLLVASLARLRHRYPSAGWVVMGSGEQRAEAEQRIREAGLEDCVLLAGDVDHDTCLSVMSTCDVFVRPTLADGDSISVREALALGIPVVASRTGTRPPGALLFQPGDLEGMLAQLELALAAKSRNPARSPGCMDRLLEIYRQADGSTPNLVLTWK